MTVLAYIYMYLYFLFLGVLLLGGGLFSFVILTYCHWKGKAVCLGGKNNLCTFQLSFGISNFRSKIHICFFHLINKFFQGKALLFFEWMQKEILHKEINRIHFFHLAFCKLFKSANEDIKCMWLAQENEPDKRDLDTLGEWKYTTLVLFRHYNNTYKAITIRVPLLYPHAEVIQNAFETAMGVTEIY